ncbi:MAG: tRNA dihydrouridine synthase DusB [Candidatus Woesearchaeota archaeon]
MAKNYKIGNVKLANPFVLAPLHGVNCLAFRLLCKEFGASLVYTSMIHVNWLVKEKKLPDSIEISEDERPLAVQLIGNDPKTMKQAVEILESSVINSVDSNKNIDIIDLNFGCPDGDVLGWKMGAYLMKHPDKIPKLIEAAKSATDKPITAKIRTGWDEKTINCIEVGKMIEDAGADAVTLHARTRKQVYSGKADWSLIKKLKENINIPVIGNGDVDNGKLGKSMLNRTGCDMVMIGRGAMGYPFVFEDCIRYLKTGKEYIPSIEERYDYIKKFLDYYKTKQERYKFSELKQHMMWNWKWLKGAKEFRVEIMRTKDEDEMMELVEKYFTNNNYI